VASINSNSKPVSVDQACPGPASAAFGAPTGRSYYIQFGILLIYLIVAVIATYPLVNGISSHIPMPSYIMDRPWIHSLWGYLWWMWYVKYSIFQLHALPVYTNFLFYPVGISCLSNFIQCIAPSILAIPTFVMFSPVLAGNILLLLSISLSGYSAYLLARYLVNNDWAAFLAGFAFSFSSPLMANAQGHLLVVADIPLIPLFILCLLKIREENSNRNLYLLTLLSLLLFFSYWYFTVFAFIFFLTYFLLRPFQGPALSRLLRSGLMFLLLAAPLALFIKFKEGGSFQAPLKVAQDWSVDLIAFLLPNGDHLLSGPWAREIRSNLLANPTIQSAYLGYPYLMLAVIGIATTKWKHTKIWVAPFILFSLLALGPMLHVNGRTIFGSQQWSVPLPFILFHKLPVLNAIRDCSMFLIVSSLCLAILVGYGVKAILDRVTRKAIGYAAILALVALDTITLQFPTYRVEQAPIVPLGTRRALPSQSTLVDIPLRSDILTYQFYQTYHEEKLLTGAFSRMAPFYGSYGDEIPIIHFFKNPGLLAHMNREQTEQIEKDASWLVNFFNIHTIILHERFLSKEDLSRMDRFLRNHFNITNMEKDSSGRVVYSIGQMRPPTSEHIKIDFARSQNRCIKRGWSQPEQWGKDFGVSWSDESNSDLFVYLEGSRPYLLTANLLPFSYQGSPQQTVNVFLNGKLLDTLSLLKKEFSVCKIKIPANVIRTGVNHLNFSYGYTGRPSELIPESTDTRDLAVAFNYLSLDSLGNPPKPTPSVQQVTR